MADDNSNDLKKQALMKIIGSSQPQMNTILGVGQQHPDYKQMAENLGISGAPASQFPGLSSFFSPADSKYNGLGGVSDNKMGYVSPTAGQPSLNRAGGPLDVSPSGVAGEAVSMATNPNNYIAPGLQTGMGGVSTVAGSFPNLKRAMHPEEYMEMVKNDPKVQELMAQESIRGKVPDEAQQAVNSLAKNKDIISSSKSSGEDTDIIDNPDEDEDDKE